MNVSGYEIIDRFTTAGGGRCEWAFASRGGTQFFIKRFLQPRPVLSGQPGGPKALAARRERSALFESRQNRILERLAGKTGRGGNLIAPLDFFVADGSYYKVTEKIDPDGIAMDDVRRLDRDAQLLILRSAANSLRILHSCEIIHGDVKGDNILLRRRSGDAWTASLIDFDDSYFISEAPINPDDFVMDPPYSAPEVFRFINEPSAFNRSALTFAADVFSLGIVFLEYLTGDKPRVAPPYRYYGEALLRGVAPNLPIVPDREQELGVVRRMLSAEAHARPTLKEVLEGLGNVAPSRRPKAVSPVEGTAGTGPHKLKIRMGSDVDRPKSSGPAAPTAPGLPVGSKLRGKLAPGRKATD